MIEISNDWRESINDHREMQSDDKETTVTSLRGIVIQYICFF